MREQVNSVLGGDAQVIFTSNQMLCLGVRLASVSSNVKFLLCFQQTLVGALLTPEDEGVLITSLVKKLQKTPWAFSTLWEAV